MPTDSGWAATMLSISSADAPSMAATSVGVCGLGSGSDRKTWAASRMITVRAPISTKAPTMVRCGERPSAGAVADSTPGAAGSPSVTCSPAANSSTAASSASYPARSRSAVSSSSSPAATCSASSSRSRSACRRRSSMGAGSRRPLRLPLTPDPLIQRAPRGTGRLATAQNHDDTQPDGGHRQQPQQEGASPRTGDRAGCRRRSEP